MIRLASSGRRFSASLFALLAALVLAGLLLKPFIAASGLSVPPTFNQLSRALAYDNSNPSYYYRRGLHYYYNPSERDLSLALNSYVTAIGLSPANAMYWIGLSKVFESAGEFEAASRALDRAILLNPTYEKPRWMRVNSLLRRGESIEALHELRRIIKDHPFERPRAYGVLHMVTQNNHELIAREGIPLERAAMEDYLTYLASKNDKAGQSMVWDLLINKFEISEDLSTKYINYLVSIGRILEARRYLAEYRGMDAGALEPLFNGGFEEDICDNRLCWEFARVEGAFARIDEGISFGGARSLKISFDGKSNVDFYHVSKVMPLAPVTSYMLSASIRADDITTANGLFMEFYGTGGCKFYSKSEALTGSVPWKEVRIETVTPPGCKAGTIRFRRLKSGKLDNLVGGSIWVDNVRLLKAGAR